MTRNNMQQSKAEQVVQKKAEASALKKPWLKKDSNPIRFLALIILLFFGSIPFIFLFKDWWSPDTAFNLVGIVCNLVGALWIASGVYLFSEDMKHLQSGNHARSKFSKKLALLLESASNVIPFGILYLILGSFYQALALVGKELNWFI